MTRNAKDVAAGAVFFAMGLALGSYALLTLDNGTVLRMGPGFFPLLLSGLLMIIGGVTALSAIGARNSPIGEVPWQALALVLISPIAFGATIRGLGFVPATVLTIMLAVLAIRRMSPVTALLITAGLTAFCVLIFVVGLNVPVHLFGPWLVGWRGIPWS